MLISERNYENAKEQAHIQTRAYLSVTAINILDFEAGKAPIIHLGIKNAGTTPAQNIIIRSHIAFTEIDKDPSVNLPSIMLNVASVLPPSGESYVRSYEHSPLSEADFAAFQAQQKTLKAVIFINYSDVYGANHSYRLCMMKTPLQKYEPAGAAMCR